MTTQDTVLFTGTFDPIHAGHIQQLLRTYRQQSFQCVVIALIQENPKKPHALAWEHRVALAEILVADSELPFEVAIETIEYVYPENLRNFCRKHQLPLGVRRTVASDSICEFAEDPSLAEALTMFDYRISRRPYISDESLNGAIQKIMKATQGAFSYEILDPLPENDLYLAARELRIDIGHASVDGSISERQLDYISRNKLYR